MKLLRSIYNDLISLRLQLLILAYGFCIFVILKKESSSVILAAISQLTCIHGFYFHSKYTESNHQHELSLKGVGILQDFNAFKNKAQESDRPL